MRLTDRQISSLKPPKRGQKTYFDDSVTGFGIRVSVGGAKSFILMYGKRRKLKTIGRYPALSLSEARIIAKQVQGEVAAHHGDLGGRSASMSFSEVRERFLEDARHHTKASTLKEYRRLLTKHFMFTKPLAHIKRQDVMDIVASLKDRPSAAHHAFVVICTLMNWAIRRGHLEVSPVPALRFKAVSRTRILTDEELKAVWHRATVTGYPHGTIVQLLILTGQRRGEIAGLCRSWIKGDEITFPTGFCKNKLEHRIPIGDLTKQIIENIPGETDLLFPARSRIDTPFSGWSKSKREFDAPLGIPEYTLHDLRRTYSSTLAKLGVPIHVTERLLNHVSGTVSGIAAVYNRHTYADEMRESVRKYEESLRGIFS